MSESRWECVVPMSVRFRTCTEARSHASCRNNGWLEGFERIPGESAGTWAPDDERAPKLVLHSTEGGSIAGAVAAFRSHRSWPHVTADPVRRKAVEHLPLDVPARALKNTTAPGETNREPVTLQLEIVGTAHDPDRAGDLTSTASFTPDELDWLGREVVGPMCRAAGIDLQAGATFYSERCGWTLATSSARQRLSAKAWDTAAGIFGHQHVPENDHWDPGAINIARIITAARGTQHPTEKEDDMTPADLAAITDAIEKTLPFAVRLTAAHGAYKRGEVVIIDPAAGTCWPVGRATLNALYFVGAIRQDAGNNPPPGNPADWSSVLTDHR